MVLANIPIMLRACNNYVHLQSWLLLELLMCNCHSLVTLSVCVMLKFYYFAAEVHAYTSLNSTITETEIMDLQLKNEGSSHQLMPGFIFETTVWFTFKSNFSQPLFLFNDIFYLMIVVNCTFLNYLEINKIILINKYSKVR